MYYIIFYPRRLWNITFLPYLEDKMKGGSHVTWQVEERKHYPAYYAA